MFHFIDYTKACENQNTQRNSQNDQKNLNVNGKDRTLVNNVQWKIVRQGCVLSPYMFNVYSEIIIKSIQDMPGIPVGGHKVNSIRHGDDKILMSENEMHL